MFPIDLDSLFGLLRGRRIGGAPKEQQHGGQNGGEPMNQEFIDLSGCSPNGAAEGLIAGGPNRSSLPRSSPEFHRLNPLRRCEIAELSSVLGHR